MTVTPSVAEDCWPTVRRPKRSPSIYQLASRVSKEGCFVNARISAATRAHGLTYGRFINALKKANVLLDRKVLSDMAIKDAAGFEQLVGLAKQHLAPATA